ncbi:MAG: LTA synthase family protein [Methylophilaceae bacterium]
MNSPTANTTKQRPILFAALIGLIAVSFWLILRFVLWFNVGPAQTGFAPSIAALGLGAWFDTWTLAYLITPFLILSALLPNRWRASKASHIIRWASAWVIAFSLLFGVISEFIFWQEFTTRFNFIAVDYLIYTNEVIGNIRESYPVPLIMAGIGLFSLVLVLALRKYFRFSDTPRTYKQRFAILAIAIILPTLSYNVANIDQAQVTNNAYANELSGNGLFTLAAAMRRNELDYDKFYQTMDQKKADETLASLGVTRTPLTNITRHIIKANFTEKEEIGPFTRRPKNVVLISVESLSAEYLGAYGSKDNLTPNLDKIAAQGLKFENLFATGTRTVRGLDALSLGAPPIPGQAIVHRPNNDHLATVGEFMEAKGYQTYFIYGGYGYFDNMNAYFRGNDYKVIDRTDFNADEIAAENVWGVADESLFNHTLKTLDQSFAKNQPFFAHVMTTSNHRPFTFPEGRVDMPQGNRDGAVKYTDYALGKFIEDAKTKPWFKDTLFVIVADHCASVAGKTKLPVAKYHIPLIFYAPDMLAAGTYKRMASQIDIAPTLIDLVGVKGDDTFFGQSLFKAQNTPARAFISNYQELGYYKDNTLIVLSPKQKAEAFKIDPVTLDAEKTDMNQQLLDEAIAYYQTASREFKKGALKEFPPKTVVALK